MELNDLHRHTGTPGDGRKINAQTGLEALGVAAVNVGVGNILTYPDFNLGAGALGTGANKVVLPDLMSAQFDIVFGIPDDCREFVGLEILFLNTTPNSNIRITPVSTIFSPGGTGTGVIGAAFSQPTPSEPGAVLRHMIITAQDLFNDVQYKRIPPKSLLQITLARNAVSASDTFNADLYIYTVRPVFK